MKFSIAIPTRNRASLISCALRSALNQDYDDFEIIVSNNYSDDNTEAVISQFDDRKLKYIKTDRPLSMVDHFNFVLEHLKGEWIMYLCDDDAIVPYTLSYISRMIEQYEKIDIFTMRHAVYTYFDMGGNDTNSLRIPREIIAKEVDMVDSQNMLKKTFKNLGGPFPRVQTSFVRTGLLDTIKHKYGKAFFPWAPDFTNGVLMLANTEKYIRLLKPLYISGKNLASYGSGSRVNPQKLEEFFSEFEEFKGQLKYSPYPKLFSVDNAIYDTFRFMLDQCLKQNEDLIIDPYIYRKKLLEELQIYIESGFDDFKEIYNQISEDIKKYPKTGDTYSELRGSIKHFVRNVLKLSIGNKVIDGNISNPRFVNIYEASLYLSQHHN